MPSICTRADRHLPLNSSASTMRNGKLRNRLHQLAQILAAKGQTRRSRRLPCPTTCGRAGAQHLRRSDDVARLPIGERDLAAGRRHVEGADRARARPGDTPGAVRPAQTASRLSIRLRCTPRAITRLRCAARSSAAKMLGWRSARNRSDRDVPPQPHRDVASEVCTTPHLELRSIRRGSCVPFGSKNGSGNDLSRSVPESAVRVNWLPSCACWAPHSPRPMAFFRVGLKPTTVTWPTSCCADLNRALACHGHRLSRRFRSRRAFAPGRPP